MLKEWTIKKHIIISVAVSMIIGVVLLIYFVRVIMLKEWTIKKHIIISVAVSMIIGVVLYIIIQPESFETIAIASENQSSNLTTSN